MKSSIAILCRSALFLILYFTLFMGAAELIAQAYYVDVDPVTPGLQSTYSTAAGGPIFGVDVYMISPGPGAAPIFDTYGIAVEFNDVLGILTLALPDFLDPTGAGITAAVIPPDILTDMFSGAPIGPGAPLTPFGFAAGAIGTAGPFTGSDGGVAINLTSAPLTPPLAPFFGGPLGFPPAGTPIFLHTVFFAPTVMGTTDVAPIGLFAAGFGVCTLPPATTPAPPILFWPAVGEVLDYWGTCFGTPAAAVISIPPFPAITPGVITVTAAVPVELTSFEASVKGQSVILNWETESERNNSGFEIQRLLKGNIELPFEDWVSIDFVNGHNHSDATKHYEYQFDKLPPGHHLFRLKQIDHDGNYSFSSIESVEIKYEGNHYLGKPFPNPAREIITIPLTLNKAQNIRLELIDLAGRHVQLLQDGPLPAGENMILAGVEQLLPGIYIYKLSIEGKMECRRLVID